MTCKTGQAVAATFTTSDPVTGAAMDATGTPVGTLYVDGIASGTGVTVTKPTGTGIYKAAVTLPSLTVGQTVAIHIAATVNAVAGAGIIWQDIADTKIASDAVSLLPTALVSGRMDASVGALANDVITAAAHDESTAFPLAGASSTLATAANQATILARLGSWTGTGINTILGALRALMNKAIAAPTDITSGGTYDASTDSLEGIRDTVPLGSAMRGTDSAALATTALSNAVWTDAKAGYLTGAVALEATAQSILTDTGTTLDGRIPAALVGGRMDASVGAMAADVITAAAHDESTAYPLAAASSALATSTAVAALKTILDKLDSAMAADGAVWQLTANALELAPTSSASISDADKTAIAQRAWNSAYVATRALTQTAAQVAAVLAGSTLTLPRGDTWTIVLTGLGSMSTHSKLWFTIKQALGEADTEAQVQVEHTAGLVRIAGAAPSLATDATLVIDDAALGNITVTVKPAATALLSYRMGLVYDVQLLDADGSVHTLTSGTANIIGDTTRAVL